MIAAWWHQLIHWHRMNIVTYASGDKSYYCNDCGWKKLAR